MGLSAGAVSMLLLASFILYGGLLYFVLIALGRDPVGLLPRPFRRFMRVPANRYGAVLAVVLILVVPALGSEGIEEDGGGGGGNGGHLDLLDKAFSDGGDLNEGENVTLPPFDTGGRVSVANFTLTWTDEPDSFPRTNDGDTFELRVIAPDGFENSKEGTNEHGQDGMISIEFFYDDLPQDGEWTAVVTLVEAGDQTNPYDPTHLTDEADDGNSFSIDVLMLYFEE